MEDLKHQFFISELLICNYLEIDVLIHQYFDHMFNLGKMKFVKYYI